MVSTEWLRYTVVFEYLKLLSPEHALLLKKCLQAPSLTPLLLLKEDIQCHVHPVNFYRSNFFFYCFDRNQADLCHLYTHSKTVKMLWRMSSVGFRTVFIQVNITVHWPVMIHCQRGLDEIYEWQNLCSWFPRGTCCLPHLFYILYIFTHNLKIRLRWPGSCSSCGIYIFSRLVNFVEVLSFSVWNYLGCCTMCFAGGYTHFSLTFKMDTASFEICHRCQMSLFSEVIELCFMVHIFLDS